jgi:anti-sigma regulatory factor (Ser/Thr protein kinase)
MISSDERSGPSRGVLIVDGPDPHASYVSEAIDRQPGIHVMARPVAAGAAVSNFDELHPDVVLFVGQPPYLGLTQLFGRIRGVAPHPTVIIAPQAPVDPVADVGGAAERVANTVARLHNEHVVGSWRLPGDATAASVGRRLAVGLIEDWNRQPASDDVELVVSELVTNAISHTTDGCVLTIRLDGQSVLVQVRDEGGGAVRRRVPHRGRPGGRGLTIVDAVSDSWGVEEHVNGKVVWSRMPATSGPGTS